MTRRRLRLLLPVVGLVILGATASGAPSAGETARPPRRVAASRDGARPRLATWRESARPPAEVPPTAIVRAAKRDKAPGGARRTGRQAARPEPVEIIWHAPGS